MNLDELLAKYNMEDTSSIKRYNQCFINEDGSVDVKGDVCLVYNKLIKLPFKFGKVSGSFTCANNNLTTLEGCPDYVGLNFFCGNNKLTNLIGSPKYVGRYFFCEYNKLINYKGISDFIGCNFHCNEFSIPGKLIRDNPNILYDKNLRKILL